MAWIALYRPQIRLFTGEVVPFEPYPFEAEYLQALDTPAPTLVVKARQLGLSTTTMVKVAQDLCERPGAVTLVISRKQDVAVHLLQIARLAYETATRPGKPRILTDNQQNFAVEGGGEVIVETANKGAGRSFTGYRLVFDEFAHLPWQEDMWTSALPTVEASGNVVLLSTPNGQGDEFERLWAKHHDPARANHWGRVELPGSRWRVFRLPWQAHPTRDEAWKSAQLESMTRSAFMQEHDCDFLSSGDPVFRAEDLQACIALYAQHQGRAVSRQVWGADVSGEGRDESVITVLDASAIPWLVLEQVAWDIIPGPAFQAEIERRAAGGNEGAIDYTGVGYGIAQNLNCPHRRVTFTAGNAVTGDHQHQAVPRRVLLSNAIQRVERREVALNPEDRELIRALQTARWKKGRGEFVDRLDSWLLAVWMAANPPLSEIEQEEIVGMEDLYEGWQPDLLGAAR